MFILTCALRLLPLSTSDKGTKHGRDCKLHAARRPEALGVLPKRPCRVVWAVPNRRLYNTPRVHNRAFDLRGHLLAHRLDPGSIHDVRGPFKVP